MRRCPVWLLLWLFCLGCHSLVGLQLDDGGPEAEELWDQGQAALKEGNADRAIGFYTQSLAADPALLRNHLSLAAAFLEKGDDANACEHLAKYVAAHPEHHTVRAHYAELLLRLQRLTDARTQYERYLTDAQEKTDANFEPLIQAHSRLMDIAEATENEYDMHLHRGIGLYWLALQAPIAPTPKANCPWKVCCARRPAN